MKFGSRCTMPSFQNRVTRWLRLPSFANELSFEFPEDSSPNTADYNILWPFFRLRGPRSWRRGCKTISTTKYKPPQISKALISCFKIFNSNMTFSEDRYRAPSLFNRSSTNQPSLTRQPLRSLPTPMRRMTTVLDCEERHKTLPRARMKLTRDLRSLLSPRLVMML
jgi:hypothetical protein